MAFDLRIVDAVWGMGVFSSARALVHLLNTNMSYCRSCRLPLNEWQSLLSNDLWHR